MSKELVSDEVWEIVEPLLPEEPPEPGGSRPRVPDRAALAGIVFVLKSGIRWEMPPEGKGRGSGSFSNLCAMCMGFMIRNTTPSREYNSGSH
jgi:transposase